MSGQRRVRRKGELEKGGEVKRSQEPGVRGVEEDKEGDGCFGGVPCKKKKKAKRVSDGPRSAASPARSRSP